MTQSRKKGKSSFHKVEQDRAEGTVYSGPDFKQEQVDENLYKARKNMEEESLREQKRETSETL